eukprot:CAMPEP_0115319854 /NCGR_PEP_ID=MMETSP0270-20121206/80001_1 /TAXON_ID=71861 /ORGANISM="Scrippsiella trochoidea, Strain CCMP3099" /LENGTH=918 /DNA_ID=CAMNT_0002739601 /DNA_START=1 /DNA_END=2757 /DNA_ORIENTATION=+
MAFSVVLASMLAAALADVDTGTCAHSPAASCDIATRHPEVYFSSQPGNRPGFATEGARRDFTAAYIRALGSPASLLEVLRAAGFLADPAVRGELLVAGAGVRVNQMALETMQAIDEADLVLFSVADAVTESFLQTRRPDAVSLYGLYSDGKLGDEADIQAAEAIIAPLRLGLRVVAVLFGHPGVLDFRGHRAVAIAKMEGFAARMLPAVSVSDNLYADLGVDPSSPGMQTMEATDILLRARKLDPTNGATIYQVGCVGDPVFHSTGSSNPKFLAFVQQLMSTYNSSHRVAIYVASMRPMDRPIVNVHSLGELASMTREEVQARVAGIATMYVPPTHSAPFNTTLDDLEVYRNYEERGLTADPFGYGTQEIQAIANLTNFTMPSFYEYVEVRDGQVMDFMLDLALDPRMRNRFESHPEAALQNYGLTMKRVTAYMRGFGGIFFGTMVRNHNIIQHYRNKIMHHHNVVNNYFLNFNESDWAGRHVPLPVVSLDPVGTLRKRINLTGVDIRKGATEAFMRALSQPDIAADALRLVLARVAEGRRGPGELVVVGTGIRVNQVTLETLQAVDEADLVLYSLADSVTESFIRKRRPDSIDLYGLYGNGKLRDETYTQTAEAMLAPARLGLRVVAVFYGHPGVFDFPSHRAIAIARAEGIRARMLPAISASDNLYADLGVDPLAPGTQTLEATDLLLRTRDLDRGSHTLIYQVGGIGDPGFNYTGSSNPKFHPFVQRLLSLYGQSHKVVLYIANRLPVGAPTIHVRTLSELSAISAAELEQVVTGITTMFVPALRQAPLDTRVLEREQLDIYRGGARGNPFGYGEVEAQSIRRLADFTLSDGKAHPEHASDTADVARLLLHLTMEPRAQQAFADDPTEFLRGQNISLARIATYADDPSMDIYMTKTYRSAPAILPHVLLAAGQTA